ncbi:cation transporter [Candidatus Gottesmanbacteria bacterium]|nr:cation transporter [Candidatus Gottesmanbacteria bacterium]
MVKKSYKVLGMHCTSCPLIIESDLEDAGVKASCNYARETLDVEYDEEKVNELRVHAVVKKAGYQVA